MIAFDADVLSELFRGSPQFVDRANSVPSDQHSIPVIVVEEILRGRLNMIRRAEAGRAGIGIERAYDLFQETVRVISQFQVLAYTAAAEQLYQDWRRQKLRLGTHDLRIAAMCIAHSAKLISGN